MQKIKAVAYARYSSDKQQESSIVVQIGEIRKFCKMHNVDIVHEYIDEAQSGTNANRHSFQEMVQEAPFRTFQFIIVHRMDRWARNVDDARYYKKYFAKYGIKIISTIENFDATPEGEFFELLSMGMAELYSKKLSRESVAGRIANARECKAHGGTPALGYKVEGKRYVINENEAEAVRIIFEMFKEGYTYREIRDYLNDSGYRRSNGKKYTANFHDVLKNRKYIGEYVFNRSAPKDVYGRRNHHANKPESEIIRIPNGIPRIIDDKLFHDVQNLLLARKEHNNYPIVKDRKYLLSGLLRCPCGCSIVGDVERTHNRKFEYGVYKCNNKECSNKTKKIRVKYLDDYIINLFTKCILIKRSSRLLNELILSKLYEAKEEIKERMRDNETIIDKLKQEILSEQNCDDYEKSTNLKLFSIDRIADLKNEIKELELDNRLLMEDYDNFPELDSDIILKNVNKFRANILSDDLIAKRQTIISLIDKIVIDNNEIRITLKLNRFLSSDSIIKATIIVDRDLVAISKNHEGQSFAFTKLKIV